MNIWKAHGPTGSLMQRLARYALLGWLLFMVFAIAFIFLALDCVWRTPPIVAVSASGRILGRMEWLSDKHRSRTELLAASIRFVTDYLSVNSATIMDDYTTALSMMGRKLFVKTIRALRKTRYLARVRLAHTRSWVVFDQGARAPHIVRQEGDTSSVVLRGVIKVIFPNNQEYTRAFALLVVVHVVARNFHNTAGIKVISLREIS